MIYDLYGGAALLVGRLKGQPEPMVSKKGNNYVRLKVSYVPNTRQARPAFVIVLGTYAAYARTIRDGDCVLCVGKHEDTVDESGQAWVHLLVSPLEYSFIASSPIMQAHKTYANRRMRGLSDPETEAELAEFRREALKEQKELKTRKKRKEYEDDGEFKTVDLSEFY